MNWTGSKGVPMITDICKQIIMVCITIVVVDAAMPKLRKVGSCIRETITNLTEGD